MNVSGVISLFIFTNIIFVTSIFMTEYEEERAILFHFSNNVLNLKSERKW